MRYVIYSAEARCCWGRGEGADHNAAMPCPQSAHACICPKNAHACIRPQSAHTQSEYKQKQQQTFFAQVEKSAKSMADTEYGNDEFEATEEAAETKPEEAKV